MPVLLVVGAPIIERDCGASPAAQPRVIVS
jgi:hypothetical protein